jgi:hypothetical protein
MTELKDYNEVVWIDVCPVVEDCYPRYRMVTSSENFFSERVGIGQENSFLSCVMRARW